MSPTQFEFSRLRSLRRLVRGDRAEEAPSSKAARVVCVASGKGGTGKSVMATNMAVLRAQRGERVLLLDFDAGLANDHLLLGISPRYDLGHVMDGTVEARAALEEGPCGLALLSGGVGRAALANPTRRELDRLFKALSPLERAYDLIIVDHGAGLGYGTLAHLAATRTLLLVTGHEVTALSDAYALFKRAVTVNDDIRVGLVVNRAPTEASAMGAWERFQSVSRKFLGKEPELVGWVPSDPQVPESVQARRPIALEGLGTPIDQALHQVSAWEGWDAALTPRAFYERARRALR